MVKVLAAEFPPRDDLWARLPDLKHPSLLRTYRVAREQDFYAEIQEFCEGGTLDACVPRGGRPHLPWESIERGIVASFLAGAAYLHVNGIVHRDIKPKNLYLRKTGDRVSLVIADFDISSVIHTDNTSRDTPRGAGTHYYMAPEAFPRFVDPSAGRAAAIVSPASDFYSFGVVLIELLVGTTVLQSGRWSDVYDFYMAGGRLEIPDDLPPRARELIQGLLIRNRRTRWGAAEVGRWLRNETTDADRQKIRDDIGFELVRRAARPYNVFKSAPTDVHGLALAMMEEPQIAEEELMSGDVLVNWLGELDAKLSREVRREREEHRQQPRLALMSALMRLDPTLPFTLTPGLTVTTLKELIARGEEWIQAGKMDIAVAVNRGNLNRLEAWLRLKADPDISAANGVAILYEAWWGNRTTTVLNPVAQRIAWEELHWIADPLRPFHITPSVAVRTPAELARVCYGTNADWANGVPSVYRAALERWREGWLGAWLRQRARDENGVVSPTVLQIESLRQKDTLAKEPMWEVVLRMMDPRLPKVRLRITDPGETTHLITEWGQIANGILNFEAVGPGLPFGIWKVMNAPPGLHFDPVEINVRKGVIKFRLTTEYNLEPGSAGTAQISLEPGGNCMLEEAGSIVYRVRQPDAERNNFIRNGALLGAAIAGGARLVAFAITGPEWKETTSSTNSGTTTNSQTATSGQTTTESTSQADDPPPNYVIAAPVMILGAVLGFYVWLNALKKYARK
jgi:hypothetical protein